MENVANPKIRIGIPYWSRGDGVSILHSRIVENLGYEPVDFIYDQKLPESLTAIFLYGPWGSMTPMISQLRERSPENRPILIWWLTEQLPNPALPEWFRYSAGYFRNWLEQLAYRRHEDGSWAKRKYIGSLLSSKALRFRYYGDLYWLRRSRVKTLIIQSSPWSNEFLTKRGFNIFAPPNPSYYSDWGADLKLERDIPVLWIGKVATRRRRQLLDRIQMELREHGIELLRIDGESNPYVFGDERTKILNRSKIVLNILRAKWDNNAMRFQLAALNRALILTEPMFNHTQFQPGVHLIEAEIDEITDKILYYLSHGEESQKITDQAYLLITRSSRDEVIGQILEECLKRRYN
jgi:hypothetical protein